MKFYHNELQFEVPETVYYPREDSLLLAKVLEGMDLKNKHILEIGCGCGFLSVVMAKAGASVTSADVNEDAVEITKENAKANGTNLHALRSDLFSAITGIFDLIVFNPPYLPTEEGENDKTYAGGTNGREVIGKFAAQVKNYLKPDGFALIVISSLTGEQETIELFEKENMKAKAIARERVPWEDLIVVRVCQEPY